MTDELVGGRKSFVDNRILTFHLITFCLFLCLEKQGTFVKSGGAVLTTNRRKQLRDCAMAGVYTHFSKKTFTSAVNLVVKITVSRKKG